MKTEKNETTKRKRGRPKGSVTVNRGPKDYGGQANHPFELRKKKLFAKAVNKHAAKTIGELKALLFDIEDRAALEIMAIRALLNAAENGTTSAINMVLNTNAQPKVSGKPPKVAPRAAEAPDLPDASEFDE